MQLPDKIEIPDYTATTQRWIDRIDWQAVRKACKHPGASVQIKVYIQHHGHTALAKIMAQNRWIERIESGLHDPLTISADEIARAGGSKWEWLAESQQELHVLYNARSAPVDVLKVLQYVDALFAKGAAQGLALMNYLSALHSERQRLDDERQRAEHERERERVEAEEALRRQKQERAEESRRKLADALRLDDELIKSALAERQAKDEKWDAIRALHTSVQEGFIYLMSNELMPGIYKIGFSAADPARRATSLDKQYRLPGRFKVVKYWSTRTPYVVEQKIFSALIDHRTSGEFFQVDLEIAKSTIESHLIPLDPDHHEA
ncbi:GIY-YIG nuclease family protein [Burkholderia sp. Ac-20365]|uniref:GIY-YIG nuclease family protein n=1 Tax=Burkholderia sp. Ac-20365 TaxID=2703897 RepID=UPI00197C3E35|nr:GIY-YIG nuclease family protein [Burkholderia sp. Ac-20365]MBN3761147.1 GIY-YIG nuclease family protein [Burkholderia sp. Ac-20365]